MLNNLSLVLDKAQAYAEAKKFEPTNLLNARLAPDQFDLTRQIQITCDTAKAFVSKMSGRAAPVHEDTESSVSELKQRIQKTIQYLSDFKPADFNGWEAQKITNPRREGKYLAGSDFAMSHAIPNFYFHFTMAYSILRNNGVDVGKKDYLGPINWRAL